MLEKSWRKLLLRTYRTSFVSHQMMIKIKVVENSIPEMFHFGHLSISRIEMLILANNSYFWSYFSIFPVIKVGQKQLFWHHGLRIFLEHKNIDFETRWSKWKFFGPRILIDSHIYHRNMKVAFVVFFIFCCECC